MPNHLVDFVDSALLGHLLSFGVITKLAGLGILTRGVAVEILDDALFQLEEQQANFPEAQAAFESARRFLERARDNLPTISPEPPWRNP